MNKDTAPMGECFGDKSPLGGSRIWCDNCQGYVGQPHACAKQPTPSAEGEAEAVTLECCVLCETPKQMQNFGEVTCDNPKCEIFQKKTGNCAFRKFVKYSELEAARKRVQELEQRLAKAKEHFEARTKRSFYRWSCGAEYSPDDWQNEGFIKMAKEALSAIEEGK